jgi:hypothetical protein
MSMVETKQVNIRLPNDLFQKLETAGRPKTDLIIEALNQYFEGGRQSDNKEVELLKLELEYIKNKHDEVLKLFHQEQVLHVQMQNMLQPSKEETIEKKWWQFWR